MSRFFVMLVMETCSIICAVFAGLLAFHGKPGWGWFLLVAVMTTVIGSSSGSKE